MGGKILSVSRECEREKRRKAQETMDMARNSQSLEYWRTFFGSATGDIFQVIKNSIHIASQDHPAEFSGRCNQLIERFTDHRQRKNEEEVMRIKDLLMANWKEQPENLVFESLRKLQSMELSAGVLKATKIEKIIKHLRKHPIKRIKHLAKILINCWKLLEDEQVNTAIKTQTYDSESVNLFPAKEKSGVSFLDQNAGLQATKSFNRTATTMHSQAEHIDREEDVVRQVFSGSVKPDKSYKRSTNPQDVPSNPVTKTSLTQGFDQKKKCNDQLFQAKLETAKRKLQDSYLLALPAPDQNLGLQATKSFNRIAATIHSQTEHIGKEEDVVRQALPGSVKLDRSYKRATNSQDVPSNPVIKTSLPQDFDQEKKCNDQLFQARLETTKRKLQDAYLKEKLAKKQRCIKVIEFKDLPKKDNHQKMKDRCCPKKWTNCQAKYTTLPLLK